MKTFKYFREQAPDQESPTDDTEKETAISNQLKSKENRQKMIKKQVLLKKLQAVRAGAHKGIVAHYEPEGELVEGVYERRKTKEVIAALKRDKRNLPYKTKASIARRIVADKGDTSRSDDRYAYEEVQYSEGVMKFVKSIGRKKAAKKAEMDKTTQKLHKWRKDREQEEREKYVSPFRPIEKEEVQYNEGMIDVIKKGAKRHKDAVEKKKIKNRKAVPYAALAAQYDPEGELVDETYFDSNTRGVSTKGGLRKQYNKPGKLSQSSFSHERKSKKPELRMSKKELRKSMEDDANYEKKMGRSKPTPSNLKTALKKQSANEEVVVERLGGKGYQPYTNLRGERISGDWEDSDRGGGHKWKKKVGKPVKKNSPTYLAHVHNKKVSEGEDKAFNYVLGKLKDKYGSGVMTKGDKMPEPSAAQKKKNAEIRAKRAKEDHRDPTEKASDGRYSDRYSNRGSD